MEYVAFITFLIWMGILILLSFLCNTLLGRISTRRSYLYFIWLGVLVHEYSHALACVLTHTKITEIKFDRGGGYVKHQRCNPLVNAIVSMAPLFGCSLFLLLLAWLFGILPTYWQVKGVVFYPATIDLNDTSFINSFIALLSATKETFWVNTVELFGWTTLFFLVFLYLVGSVSVCIAPSDGDLKHAAWGLLILIALGFLVLWLKPLGYIPGVIGYFGTPTPVLDFSIKWLTVALGTGLVGTLLILPILVAIALVMGK
ncbi:MAG: hypothetical protein EFT35_09025 [Methanophagales archaeon ANME-1-THS]|nr:MAG: hypothetical protein EFT35_09025 [Methanophagales archaeon ANME-1-THS]